MKENNRKKKSIGIAFMLMTFIFLLFPVDGEAKVKAPKKECHSYVVMDAGSGEVLFGQDADKVIYPASTAKIMTAIVCVEKENGNMNRKVKTQYDIVYGTTPGTYSIGIGAGVTYTLKDLLAMSLISSSADATDSLAVGVFGSKKACVDAMNQKCEELGLTKTHFDNPVGSDIGAGFKETYATAREMALITRYAMSIPLIRDIVRKSSYSPRGRDVTANTTNWFLRGMAWYDRDKYRIIGTKSGTTNAAGNVFIATAVDKKGHEVICAYFGNVSKESTFTSIRRLYDYTFSEYKKGKLKLTPSNYDIRCKGNLGKVYTKYAKLGCFPGETDGKFYKNRVVTRKELVKMVKGVNELQGSAALAVYLKENVNGNVTMNTLAHMIQMLYPSHLSQERTDEILADCKNTDNLTEEEKEAYAVFVQAKILPDDFSKNANQLLTRKQAVFFVDAFREYQMRYEITHATPYVAQQEESDSVIKYLSEVTIVNEEWTQKMDSYHKEQEEERERIAAEKAAEKAAEAATEENNK